jgi:hypothetical protein
LKGSKSSKDQKILNPEESNNQNLELKISKSI